MRVLPFQAFGSLECAILRVVWANSTPLTVKDIHASLGGSEIMAYTTVMTTAARLTEKGILVRVQLLPHAAAPFHYRAVISKSDLLAASIGEICARLDVDAREWGVTLAALGAAPVH
jgi:predicted transcriptional regulator